MVSRFVLCAVAVCALLSCYVGFRPESSGRGVAPMGAGLIAPPLRFYGPERSGAELSHRRILVMSEFGSAKSGSSASQSASQDCNCPSTSLIPTLYASGPLGDWVMPFSSANTWSTEDGGFPFSVQCNGPNDWSAVSDNCASNPTSVTVNSCQPLSLTVHVLESYPGCGVTMDVEVTE